MLSQKYSYVLVHDVQRETNNLVRMPFLTPSQKWHATNACLCPLRDGEKGRRNAAKNPERYIVIMLPIPACV